MPLPSQPPAGPVTLSQNARTVLEKRYLVKDEKGKVQMKPVEGLSQPEMEELVKHVRALKK